MNNQIIIKSTGEIIDLDKKIEAMTNAEKSMTLTQINQIRRLTSKLEKKIKDWIKENVEFDFDDEHDTFFEDWRVKEVSSTRFSESDLLKNGTPEEIEAWKRLKEKYSKNSTYIKFG